MSIISEGKKKVIFDQILNYLYEEPLKLRFTSEIAKAIGRDEEFVLKLLYEMKEQNWLKVINKNSRGGTYVFRRRWRITNKLLEVFDEKK